MNMFEGAEGAYVRRGLMVLVWLVCAFLVVEGVSAVLGWHYIGSGVAAANTITVSGHGEIQATPTLATLTFSVVSDKSTAQAAQDDATQKQNAIDAYLKTTGIDPKDIQTSGYSVYPQYAYQTAVCPQASAGISNTASPLYCPPGKQVLTGYEARQTTTVKVRDLTKVGDVLAGVGTAGATEISGPNFTFDDPNAPQDEARQAAIKDAKAKADELAKELGVSIVRVTSFNENGSGYPRPVMYEATAGAASDKSASPTITPGQNTVSDDVTITYEIR